MTRAEYLQSIDAQRDAARAIVARYTPDQLLWQPRGGQGWSILECIDHIAVSNDVYLDAMESDVPRTGPRGADDLRPGGAFSARFIRDLEPPVKRKVPAPSKFRPRPTLDPDGILPRYIQALDRLSTFVTARADLDLNAVKFKHPSFRFVSLTAATGLLILAAHGRRHLWQAEQVHPETRL